MHYRTIPAGWKYLGKASVLHSYHHVRRKIRIGLAVLVLAAGLGLWSSPSLAGGGTRDVWGTLVLADDAELSRSRLSLGLMDWARDGWGVSGEVWLADRARLNLDCGMVLGGQVRHAFARAAQALLSFTYYFD
jgi:hypothetical protein